MYCQEVDDAYHTIYVCGRWTAIRRKAELLLGEVPSPQNMLKFMTDSKSGWIAYEEMLTSIMRRKEEEKRIRQES